MKALVGAFNQEKALVGAFSVIVQPVVEPIEHYTALTLAVPSAAVTLPRSPTCLAPFSFSGAPWEQPSGLKCGPALVQPLVLSPN